MAGRRRRFRAGFLAALLLLGATAGAEAPVAVAAPKKARARIVSAAEAYLGVPYLYGGTTKEGFDCSGLVWRVYVDTFGRAPLAAMPRTAKDLFGFVELEDRAKLQPGDLVFFDTTGRLSHVGIYAGEGHFIHAASDGRVTGVIESSLSETYWAGHYTASGRILPPGEYLGIYLTASLGPDLTSSFGFHGISAVAGVGLPLFTGELGLQLRPSYNAELGVARIPLVLAVSLDRRLTAFAGPALTLGTPSLGGTRLTPSGDLLATAGLVWRAARFRVAGLDADAYLQVTYDRYVYAAGGEASGACLSAGAGLGIRLGF